jgi:hypothetical protein
MSKQHNIACEEAQALGSASLDGALNYEENGQLFRHLAHCESCREYLADIAEMEAGLNALGGIYKNLAPGGAFHEKVQSAILSTSTSDRSFKPLVKTAGGDKSFRRAFTSALVGAMASLFLVFMLFPGTFMKNDYEAPQRFNLHPVVFRDGKDTIEWNKQHTIPPGHTLTKRVLKRHDGHYHFRLTSDGPVNVVVTHQDADSGQKKEHRFSLHGTRYASLRAPLVEDVIAIRNDGDRPVEALSFSEDENAFDHRVSKHDKTF